jgi:hypothetical protein
MDLENIHTYDWGGAMFATLIYALDHACRPRNNVAVGQCGGFTPLLQVSLIFFIIYDIYKFVYLIFSFDKSVFYLVVLVA